MKKYYVIQINNPTAGVFALFFSVTSHILFAVEQGYIPVVDLKHVQNQYFKDGKTYKENAWEYFFEQPFNIGLDDIENDAQIILSTGTPFDKYNLTPGLIPQTLDDKTRSFPYLAEVGKYLKFNKELQTYIEDEYKKLIGNEKEVLGIICRGTDYTSLRPYNHSIPPEPETLVKKAKDLFEKYNYKKIWLATEDVDIYEMFKNEFKDVMIDFEQYRFSRKENKYISELIKEDKENKDISYNIAKKYLLSMYILSRCKYIIGSRTFGTLGAYILSDNFKNTEYLDISDNGRYGIGSGVNYKNFVERIFSIKNQIFEDRKIKVITIAGIRFKSKYTSKKRED